MPSPTLEAWPRPTLVKSLVPRVASLVPFSSAGGTTKVPSLAAMMQVICLRVYFLGGLISYCIVSLLLILVFVSKCC